MSWSKNSVYVRPAGKTDLPQILRIYSQPGVDDGAKLDISVAEHLLERIESYLKYHLYMAEVESVAVGTFALLIMDNLGHLGAPSGVVEDVAVEPSMQGQGIGEIMMNYAMDKCRETGCYKLALSANLKRVEAHKFYESLGLKWHGYSFLIELDE